MKEVEEVVSSPKWLLLVLILTLGGFAFACSGGNGSDAPATLTPRDAGDAAIDTPADETEADSPTPTSESEGPADGAAGNPVAPQGPQAPGSPPLAPTSDGVMRLTILDGGFCDASECFVDVGSTFTLAVEVLRAPALNYILLQTFIEYGVYDPGASEDGAGPGSCGDGSDNGERDGVDRRDEDCVRVDLTYVSSPSAADEIVWADLSEGTALRGDIGPGTLLHGGLTGLIPPLPTSAETGVAVQFQMTCPASPVTVPISLLVFGDPVAGTSGSLFVGADGATQIIPVVSPITLHCQ